MLFPIVHVPQIRSAEPLVYRDLVFSRIGDRELRLDLYMPAEVSRPVPLIIWVHGGGWVIGSRVGAKRLPFTAYGFAVASIEYRLTKEARWPAQLEDCKAAVRWLRSHAEEYQLDSRRFGVIGHSAGGHLAALMGTTGNTGLFNNGEGSFASSEIQAVCSMAGPTNFLSMDSQAVPGTKVRHEDPDSNESNLIGAPIKSAPRKVREASPMTYLDRKDPPVCLIHGSRDQAVPPGQAVEFFDALERHGVRSELHELVGEGHSMMNRASLGIAVSFFERVLKPRSRRSAIPKRTAEIRVRTRSTMNSSRSYRGRY